MKHYLRFLIISATAFFFQVSGFSQTSDGDISNQQNEVSVSAVMPYVPCPSLAITSTITNLTFCNGANGVAGATMSASNGNPGYFYTYFNNINQSVNQGSCALPGFGSIYSAAQTRGLWFVCPTNTVLTGVRVPTDVGTANQFVYIIKLAATPPEFTGSTTTYTVLGKYLDIPGTNIIDCGIPLNTGDIIGVLGVRGSTATTNCSSSYATPSGTFLTTIGGVSTTMARFITQVNIATTPIGAVSSASTGAIGRVELYFGSSISNTSTANSLIATNYSCYYTDADGCMNTSTFAIAPAATITAATSVTNAACGANGFASVSPGSGFGAYTYSWSPAGGTGSVTSSLNSAGNYSCLITDASGNCLTSTVNVQNNITVPSLSATISSSAICVGESVTLTATGSSPTYTWNGGATGSSFTDTPLANVSYTVETGSGACTNSTVVTLTVNALPNIQANTNTSLSCAGVQVTLTASGAQTYTWNTMQTTTQISVSPTVTTTYSVNGQDANGCGNTAMVTQSVSACVGLRGNTGNEISVQVYPNPAKDVIIMESDTPASLEIINTLGQTLTIAELPEGKTRLQLNGYESGIYYVKITVNKNTSYIKIIKD
ncbi:MAG: hypothetical protein K0S32_989 [Bacteroidetes bacterium]|jgi:hypothetical protein|nr:hypothetical protein [Bacteroidota bacterium]